MKEVTIYTDGACSGNPGAGGYGVVLEYQGRRRELSQGFKCTTNNRMELMAAIAGLEALKEPCKVILYSDSRYLVDAVNKRWICNWQNNGWKTADKKCVKNVDLWNRLNSAMSRHEVVFRWVKGHAGVDANELCDRLAREAAAARVKLDDLKYVGDIAL